MTEELVAKAPVDVKRLATVFSIGALHLIENKTIAKDIIKGEKKRYSAGISKKTRQLRRAIPIKDERKYPELPSLVGTSFSDPQWTEKCENFWAEYVFQVPFGWINPETGKVEGGQEIDAGYTEDGGLFYPNNFGEFILFELMKDDIEVATNPDLYGNRGSFAFFCIDSTAEAAKAIENTKLKIDANMQLATLLVDRDVDTKLGLFRIIAGRVDPEISIIHARTMSKDEVIESLIRGSEKNPAKFLQAVNDKDLAIKAFIAEAVAAGIFTQIGENYLHKSETIGREADVISFLKNSANGDIKAEIKAQIENFAAIGIA